MIKALESILIGSADAEKLANYYREMVKLKQTMEFEMGESGNENGWGFDLGNGIGLVILDHSKVKGKNMLGDRIILNFEVDDIDNEVKRLKAAKAELIQDIYHIQDYGMVATFSDPDGNYFQLVQTHVTN
jgi:predicted enzyme related to lactoylglutathione lyase